MVAERTTTLQVDGLLRSFSQSRVRPALQRRPGVVPAEVVLLTGDDEATARRIAEQLGIDTVVAEVARLQRLRLPVPAPAGPAQAPTTVPT